MNITPKSAAIPIDDDPKPNQKKKTKERVRERKTTKSKRRVSRREKKRNNYAPSRVVVHTKPMPTTR